MALTRSFKELVQRRVAEDPAFGAALFGEGIGSPRLTMREALRQIWKAASYPGADRLRQRDGETLTRRAPRGACRI